MQMPWRAVEAMHWELGAQSMAERAGVAAFPLTSPAPGISHDSKQRSYPSYSTYPPAYNISRTLPGPSAYTPALQPAQYSVNPYPLPPQHHHVPPSLYPRPGTPPPASRRSPPSPARMRRSVSGLPPSARLSPNRRRSGSLSGPDYRPREDIPPIPPIPQILQEQTGMNSGFLPPMSQAPTHSGQLPSIHTLTDQQQQPLKAEHPAHPTERGRYVSPETNAAQNARPLQPHTGGEYGPGGNCSSGGGNGRPQ